MRKKGGFGSKNAAAKHATFPNVQSIWNQKGQEPQKVVKMLPGANKTKRTVGIHTPGIKNAAGSEDLAGENSILLVI